jgi:hypothetical protein
LKEKLDLAKIKLKEFYVLYPHLNPELIEASIKPFIESYNNIISIAYPNTIKHTVTSQNIIESPSNIVSESPIKI